MVTDFKMPDLGENIDSADVVGVLVSEGDELEANQGVVEVETDKATVEIPCPHAGRVTKIHVQPGQSVPVGGLLLSLEARQAAASPSKPAPPARPEARPSAPAQDDGDHEELAAELESGADRPAEPEAERQPAAPAARPDGARSTRAPRSANGGPARPAPQPAAAEGSAVAAPAGPSTRRLARELGVDLSRLSGTGSGGRITQEDVKKAVRQSGAAMSPAAAGALSEKKPAGAPDAVEGHDSWGRVRRQALSKIRKTIAANLARSAATIPHVTNFDDADITELERIRQGSMAEYVDSEVKLTMMPFLMKAVARSLQLHPVLNASLDLANGEIVYKEYIHLGVAVDTQRGLVVPVVRDVDRLTIPQIAQALWNVAAKVRANRFTTNDTRGGTFTISNLGAIGGTYSTPIINHPEVAVLLVGRSRELAVVVEGEVQVRLVMPLSLSYDHRLIDGAAAARFLNEVKNYLQVPGRLLLAP